MAPERKPGSNLGKAAVDWGAAFLYYAALTREQRSYQAVADHYGVSVRTVERQAGNANWKQRAAKLDRDAADAAAAQLVEERTDTLADIVKLVEASLTSYANQLRQGTVKVSPADLARLHKLLTEIWNDPTTEPAHFDDELVEPERLDPTEHKLAVLRALQDAGVLPNQQPDNHPVDADQSEVA